MKDAVYSSIPSLRENVREIASGVGKVNKKFLGFPRLLRGFLDMDSMGRVTFLLPPDDVIMSEIRTSLQPAVSSDIRRRYN